MEGTQAGDRNACIRVESQTTTKKVAFDLDRESWNLWNSMGMVCFLPGWLLISDTTASARISACLVDISSWMTAHQLKLNPSKTELLVIPGDPSPAQDLVISLNNFMISPSATARNLGGLTIYEFKLIGPSGREEYNRSAVTLSCGLSPEISAVNMEIRWFKETDCVCVYKNREVTEGRGYRGRVSLFTQELERGNVSLQLKDCTESDRGYYLCQVTDGDRTEEITVMLGIKQKHKKHFQIMFT
ncbi:hypothetical protein QTP70_012510 [Hemibagrus guttatus]|uniref:Ig-like domain-containing protein n=1 Tax=Hemibagrus guttatus TaxID=175788 RepID=A0AAE0PVQ8_9TELE|nr:hypothetical protein QTP70_012510 [Hemibagrus guttatus]